MLGRAIQVRTVLIERYPESKLSKKAVYLIGQNFQALAYYEQAAKYYEQFARKFPGEDGKRCTAEDKQNDTCPNAIEGLEQATFFRIGLGDDKAAMEDSDLFARSYKRKLPRQTSQVMFSIGSIYERQERWFQVISHYRDYLKKYGKVGAPHQLIQANTAIGRAFWELNKKSEARKHFQAAVKAWDLGRTQANSRAQEHTERNQGSVHSPGARQRGGVAVLPLGVQIRRLPESRVPAVSRGQEHGSREEVVRYGVQEVGEAKADRASGSRGRLREGRQDDGQRRRRSDEVGALADRGCLRGPARCTGVSSTSSATPRFPRKSKRTRGLFDIYVGALDDVSEPLQRQAIDKFEFCLKTATQVRWFNKWSRSCEQELNGLNPRKYPVAAELRGEPNYVKDHGRRPRRSGPRCHQSAETKHQRCGRQ